MKNFTLLKSMILSVMVILAGSLSARQLELAEALQRLNGETAGARSLSGAQTTKLQLAYTDVAADGNKIFYIVNQPSDGGMLFVSADDCAPALLGYTDSGSFSSYEDLPENMRWWLKQYETGISDAIANGRTIAKVSGTHAAVKPLLTTAWGQDAPFNNLCNDMGSKSVTGCVATAMAQIMNRWKYPTKGTGNHSYTYNSVSISSDFSAHTYDWSKMQNSYTSGGNPEGSEDAVALLMHDCGVAVNMQYSANGSGAADVMASYALTTYFGYDKSMQNVIRSFMSDEDWEELLLTELEAGRPMLYCGTDTKNGGHAFICDGYDGEGKFHFNWGWSGGADGYFLVTGTGSLNPLSYSFTSSQMILAGIRPDKGGTLSAAKFGMDNGFKIKKNLETTSDWASNVEVATSYPYFYYSSSYLANYSTRPITAVFGMKCVSDKRTEYITPYNIVTGTYDLESYYMPEGWMNARSIEYNGTYKLYPVFKDNEVENDEWHEILLPLGYDVPTITVTGGKDEPGATTVTANMNIQKSLGCATFCAPFDVTIPSGVKAYRTSMKSGDKWITLNEITGTIPAATPVVLYCENGYENNFTATPTTTATTATDGVLTGNIGSAKTEIPTGNYILQNNTQGTGWYEVKTSGLYVGVNRCYMTKPAGARQAFYAMQIGETTGINSISATAAKMSDGKYLVNGRIVVVKSGKAYNMNGTRMK